MHQLSVVMMGLLMFYIVGTFVFNPLYCFLHVSVPFYMRIPGCPRFLLQRNQGKPSLMPPSCPMNSPKRRWCLDRYKLDVAPSQLHMKVHGDSLIIFVITSGGDWHWRYKFLVFVISPWQGPLFFPAHPDSLDQTHGTRVVRRALSWGGGGTDPR